jgi:hypothetical protein
LALKLGEHREVLADVDDVMSRRESRSGPTGLSDSEHHDRSVRRRLRME